MKRVLFLLVLCIALGAGTAAPAVELNDDGRSLLQEAAQAYNGDMQDRPVVADPKIAGYVSRIASRLVPQGKSPPPGVVLHVTVLESPKPELYAYVDGHLVITTGAVFSVDNEAQLAGLLSAQVAQVVEGYYLQMYQEIKAAQRRQARKAVAGALLGALMDVAVDYAVQTTEIDTTDKYLEGEAAYAETMKRLAAAHAAREAYTSIKDVIASTPATDPGGQLIDPRLRFEPVADAQGMEYVALAGYAPEEVSRAWSHVLRVNSRILQEQEPLLGPWADQMRSMKGLMEMNMTRLRQQLGASGLVQTLSSAPPSRAQFVSTLTELKEVKEARQGRRADKGEPAYRSFLQEALLPRAERALEEEKYDQALVRFQILYDHGVRTGPVAYGLAKSRIGDFAFGASDAQKKEAESAYREAARLDPKYAAPHRGLAELYDDWERYAEAAQAYRQYLKLAPHAEDRSRIERKIKTLERKANR